MEFWIGFLLGFLTPLIILAFLAYLKDANEVRKKGIEDWNRRYGKKS